MTIVTDDGCCHQSGQGNYFNFPQASYMQITFRDNQEENPTACDGIGVVDFYQWSHEGGGGSSAVNEFDLIENWDAGVNCSPWNYGGAFHNWNDGSSGPMWGYNYCIGSCPSFLTGDKFTSSYHTYGMLTTVQSGNNIASCGYVDGILINCGTIPSAQLECTGTGGAGGTAALNQSGCWGQRSIAILWVGSANGGWLSHDIHAYIQSWQVWSCPSWNAGSATMSNPPTNTCYGSLITSENAPKGEKDTLLAMSEQDRQYVLRKMSPGIRDYWAKEGIH
jgi:hypothetical protein